MPHSDDNLELPNINQCSDRVIAKLSDKEIRLIADKIITTKPDLNTLTKRELLIVIKSLPLDPNKEKERHMKYEMGFGVKVLEMMLDREGPEHVIGFSQNVNRITKNEQDLHSSDLDTRSLQALSAARRRHVVTELGPTLGTFWVLAGSGITAFAAPKSAADAIDFVRGERTDGYTETPRMSQKVSPETDDVLPRVRQNARRKDRQWAPAANATELAVGVGLVAEGVKQWREMTREQVDEISDAVSQLTKFYPELRNPPPQKFLHASRPFRTAENSRG